MVPAPQVPSYASVLNDTTLYDDTMAAVVAEMHNAATGCRYRGDELRGPTAVWLHHTRPRRQTLLFTVCGTGCAMVGWT